MSNDDITNYYVSGWCGTCGRKRGADGRCTNCDAWWTSPLVQVGGPVVVVTCLLLFGAISMIKSKSEPPALVMQPTARLVASSAGSVSPGSPYFPPSRPVSYPSGPIAPAPFYPRTASASVTPLPNDAALREAQRLADFNRLQQMSRAADAALRADDLAREERNRSLSRSLPLSLPSRTHAPSIAPAGAIAPSAFDAPTLNNNAATAADPQS